MCPESIPAVAMTIAGTGSIGSVALLFLRKLIRAVREKTSHLKFEGEHLQ
jgi:hypothetical protein